MTQERKDFRGSRLDCRAWMEVEGLRCENGIGWYKPGHLGMVVYSRKADDRLPDGTPHEIGEVDAWDSNAPVFVASYWSTSAAPRNWL